MSRGDTQVRGRDGMYTPHNGVAAYSQSHISHIVLQNQSISCYSRNASVVPCSYAKLADYMAATHKVLSNDQLNSKTPTGLHDVLVYQSS